MSKIKLPNPFIYTLGRLFWSQPKVRKMGVRFDKKALKQIKPPMLVLANHTGKQDFHIVGAALSPYRCNFVGAVNTAVGRKKLFEKMGVLTKRQFTVSMQLVRDIKALFDKNAVVVIYPEARLSADGRLSDIPQSVVKLIKLCGVNTVAVKAEGSYLHNNKCTNFERKIPISCALSIVSKKEEIAQLSNREIYRRLIAALDYDDFKYAKENNIKIARPALRLDGILYRCPLCNEEFSIKSDDTALRCACCGGAFSVDGQGALNCPQSSIDSVAKWFDFEREQIKNSLSPHYRYEALCDVFAIADGGFKAIGEMTLIHDFSGFTLKDAKEEIFFDGRHLHAISYDPASCIYLSTDDATFKIAPKENPYIATKLAITQEEIFKFCRQTD